MFTGYQQVTNGDARAKFEKAWGVSLPDKNGCTLTEVINKAYHGEIKALYVIGENPMMSDPDLHHVEEALENLDFLIVQDIFLTETAKFAHVVFPSACFAGERQHLTNWKDGCKGLEKPLIPREKRNRIGRLSANWLPFWAIPWPIIPGRNL